MGPDVVEGAAEVVEVALLSVEVGLRRLSGFTLEGSGGPFVIQDLLGPSGSWRLLRYSITRFVGKLDGRSMP